MAIPTLSDELWELIHPLLPIKPRRYRYPGLLDLGARHADVGQTGGESWVVLADPDGNEFDILAGRRP